MIQIRRNDPSGGEAHGGPRFSSGTLVFHHRYRYRGVVVEADARCLAAKDWYQSNQTQPARDQPWYHVLPHGSGHTTYVAQENLRPDPTAQPIDHPLVGTYFDAFVDGHYVRNDTPWGM